ncbi:MAG: glycosyl transferase, partial [Desulfobacterales bacterium]|nr:glycosyl transferase [Desulfobacterales bacterium]
ETGPDLFLIELYPFGRKAFGFELEPLLEGIRTRRLPFARVVCSLRDILVEKKDPQGYEKRVLASINRYFDALLIHSDPRVIRLDETFTRVGEIRIPVVYTGFVTDRPAPDARRRLRAQLQISDGEQLVVASAGGGKVGEPLLAATVKAFAQVAEARRARLIVFTGPYLAKGLFSGLQRIAGRDVQILRFTPEFPAYLAAADLSVSMAGYNTCMNVLAAGVPALVWPFPQNREQRLRAERLQISGALEMLADEDLHPPALAVRMARRLAQGGRTPSRVDLEGAAHTARWLTDWLAGGP